MVESYIYPPKLAMVLLQEMMGVALFLPPAFVILVIILFTIQYILFRIFSPRRNDKTTRIPLWVMFIVAVVVAILLILAFLGNIDGRFT